MGILLAVLLSSWRLYPEGIPLQTTVEHELTYTIDTVQATHWHKSGNKFYIITTDSIGIWVDNVVRLRNGKTP